MQKSQLQLSLFDIDFLAKETPTRLKNIEKVLFVLPEPIYSIFEKNFSMERLKFCGNEINERLCIDFSF
jgi:hypothetical protein